MSNAVGPAELLAAVDPPVPIDDGAGPASTWAEEAGLVEDDRLEPSDEGAPASTGPSADPGQPGQFVGTTDPNLSSSYRFGLCMYNGVNQTVRDGAHVNSIHELPASLMEYFDD